MSKEAVLESVTDSVGDHVDEECWNIAVVEGVLRLRGVSEKKLTNGR